MSDARSVAIVCTDLLFRAKVRAAVSAAGFEPVALRDGELPAPSAVLLVVDLGDARIDPAAAIRAALVRDPSLQILAFASHVRDDLLATGREAGATRVVPRSKAIASLEAALVALQLPTTQV